MQLEIEDHVSTKSIKYIAMFKISAVNTDGIKLKRFTSCMVCVVVDPATRFQYLDLNTLYCMMLVVQDIRVIGRT